MTATNMNGRRKGLATYGKASRKRNLNYLMPGQREVEHDNPNSPDSDFDRTAHTFVIDSQNQAETAVNSLSALTSSNGQSPPKSITDGPRRKLKPQTPEHNGTIRPPNHDIYDLFMPDVSDNEQLDSKKQPTSIVVPLPTSPQPRKRPLSSKTSSPSLTTPRKLARVLGASLSVSGQGTSLSASGSRGSSSGTAHIRNDEQPVTDIYEVEDPTAAVATPRVAPERKRNSPNANSSHGTPRKSSPVVRAVGSQRKPGRRRLIDRLAEEDVCRKAPTESHGVHAQRTPPKSAREGLSTAKEELTTLTTSPPRRMLEPSVSNVSITTQTGGAKITYSRQRSMLEEQDLLLSLTQTDSSSQQSQDIWRLPEAPARRQAPGGRSSQAEEFDDAPQAESGIRTVHELRQAGMSRRYHDEAEDLIDRIGQPLVGKSARTSSRRSALLELLPRLLDKRFLTVVVTGGFEQRLFADMQNEKDIIGGSLVMCCLTALLHAGPSSLGDTYSSDAGILALAALLLRHDRQLTSLAKERTANMSRAMQLLLDKRQKEVAELDLWDGPRPGSLTPRLIALACLVLLTRDPANVEKYMMTGMTDLLNVLYEIAAPFSKAETWSRICIDEQTPLRLVLLMIERHSLHGRMKEGNLGCNYSWLQLLPDMLSGLLSQAASHSDAIKTILLRIILNITDSDQAATNVIATSSLLNTLFGSIIMAFSAEVTGSTDEIEVDGFDAIDNLVLMLGVMINIVQMLPSSVAHLSHESIVQAWNLYISSAEKAALADSLEDSHINVAFGYLAVLMGYMCLSGDIAAQLRTLSSTKTLEPLIGSVEEFIVYNKKVDDALLQDNVEALEAHTRLTQRLSAMVSELRSREQSLSGQA